MKAKLKTTPHTVEYLVQRCEQALQQQAQYRGMLITPREPY